MPLSPRDRRALAGGGAVIVLLLAWLLWPARESPPAPSPPAPPPSVAPATPPVAAAAPPPAPSVDVSELRLFGVMASGAVIGRADGSQRFVPIGRDVMPGVTLRRVALHHAVLATAAGEVMLAFEGVDQAPAAEPAVNAEQEERLRYRLGLAPVVAGGRVAGYTVRPGARLPALERAGVRPGDVIRRVNGALLDEERREELAWTLANSSRVEIDLERDGRPLRLTLQTG